MDRLSAAAYVRRAGSSQFARRTLLPLLLVATAAVSTFAILPYTSRIIVANDRKPADVIVVIAVKPYHDDLYYYQALDLLAKHYGQHVLLPADANGAAGETEADEARVFVDKTAGAQRGNASVCPIQGDEFQSLNACLDRLHARRVLMVAPAPESRRCLMLYRDRLPDYVWHVAAVADPANFGSRWWSNREWAKRYAEGLQRLIYAAVRD